MQLNSSHAAASLAVLQACGLLTDREVGAVTQLQAGPIQRHAELAETVHVHIKVEDTDLLPINTFFEAGARLDHQQHGFVKYRFPGSVNAIFSHIKVSQDELIETEAEIVEAIHIAGAMSAGIALVQSVQTMGKLDAKTKG